MQDNELIEIAKQARQNASSVISKYKVGAALITKQGKVYTGCNIEEKACLNLGICAERLAIYKAIEQGEKEFDRIAVIGGLEEDTILSVTPCGICRQFLLLYTPDIDVVFLDKNNNINKISIKELLPHGYNEEFIKE